MCGWICLGGDTVREYDCRRKGGKLKDGLRLGWVCGAYGDSGGGGGG